MYIRQHPILRYTRIETPQTVLLVKKETARSVIDFINMLNNEDEIKEEVKYFKGELVGLASKYIDNVTKLVDKIAYRYKDIIRTPIDHIHLAMFLSTPFQSLMTATLATSILLEARNIIEVLNKNLLKDTIILTVDDIMSRYMLFLANEESNIVSTVIDSSMILDEKVSEQKPVVPIVADDIGLIITPDITFTMSEDAANTSITVVGNILRRFTEDELAKRIKEGEKLAEKYKSKHYLVKIPLAVNILDNVVQDIALEVCREYRGNNLKKCISDVISYVLASIITSIDLHRQELVSKIARRIEKHLTTM